MVQLAVVDLQILLQENAENDSVNLHNHVSACCRGGTAGAIRKRTALYLVSVFLQPFPGDRESYFSSFIIGVTMDTSGDAAESLLRKQITTVRQWCRILATDQ